MFKRVLTVATILLMPVTAFAGGYEGGGNRVNSYSEAYSSSKSTSRATGGKAEANANNSGVNNSTSFRDRLQAPGMGVGGGYCSNALSLSFPGGGFGFSAMERMCKIEIGARVVNTYINRPNAAAYVCGQREFANLPACRSARTPRR